MLCGLLLFVDELFSVRFQEHLCIPSSMLFTRCSPFYLCLLLFSFSYLSPYSTLYPFYFLLSLLLCLFLSTLFSLKTFSPQTWIITSSSGWKILALPVLLICELIRNCKILRITVQLQPQQYDFSPKTRVANYLLTRLDIYQLTWNPRVMPNRVPTVRAQVHFIVTYRSLLAHTYGVSKLLKQLRLRITFSLALPSRNG